MQGYDTCVAASPKQSGHRQISLVDNQVRISSSVNFKTHVTIIGRDQLRNYWMALQEFLPHVEKCAPPAVAQSWRQTQFVGLTPLALNISITIGEHVRTIQFFVQMESFNRWKMKRAVFTKWVMQFRRRENELRHFRLTHVGD